MRLDDLRQATTVFRLAIELTEKSELSEAFRLFPSGACGDASLLLAAFLNEEGFGSFALVSGRYGDCDHAWLERDGIVIDITADQFCGFESAVHIGPSDWHEHFGPPRYHGLADLYLWQFADAKALLRDYTMLKSRAQLAQC